MWTFAIKEAHTEGTAALIYKVLWVYLGDGRVRKFIVVARAY